MTTTNCQATIGTEVQLAEISRNRQVAVLEMPIPTIQRDERHVSCDTKRTLIYNCSTFQTMSRMSLLAKGKNQAKQQVKQLIIMMAYEK